MNRLNAFRWSGAGITLLTLAGAFTAEAGTRRFAGRRYAERTAASAAAYLVVVTPPSRDPAAGPDPGELLRHARALAALPGWSADLEVYLGAAPLIRATDPSLPLATAGSLGAGSAPHWIAGAAYAPIPGPTPGRPVGAVRIRPRIDPDPFGVWLPSLLAVTAVAGLVAAIRLHRRRGIWWLGVYAVTALAFGGVAAGAAVMGESAATARWLRETAVLIEEAGSRSSRAPLSAVARALAPIAGDGRLAVDTSGGPGDEESQRAAPTAPRFIWFGADRWLTLAPPAEDWAAAARDAVAGTAALAGVLALLALSWGGADRVRPGQTEETLSAWMFLAPAGVHLVALTLAPLAVLGYVATHRWDLATGPGAFVGAGNLVEIATRADTWSVLGRTALFALHVPVAVAFALALALGARAANASLVRTLLVVPPFVSLTAAAVAWRQGLLSWSAFMRPGTAIWVLAGIAAVMQTGYQVPVLLAGLDRIPETLWEAAALDGARGWSRFRRVTAPLLEPVIACALVTGLVLAVQAFTLSFVMGERDLAAARIYHLGWGEGRLDLAAALSLLFLALIAGVAALQVRLLRRASGAA